MLSVALLVAFLLLFSVSSQFARAQENNSLRVMSYNIRNARGLDDKTDYSRIAEVVKKELPDVVAIQELDKKTKRSNNRDVLREIAKDVDMTPSFGAAIDFQGGQYGIGILSKDKPIKVESYPLPGSEEKRCLLAVEFDRFVLFCSHWSLTPKDRLASVAIITNKMKEQKKPVFLCGDFNAQSDEESILELQENWTILSGNNNTFPANAPKIRIDYICAADPNGKISHEKWLEAVKNSDVVSETVASDHRPVVVDVDINVFN